MKKWAFGLVLGVLVAVVLFRASVLEHIGGFLVEEDEPAHADAIFVLAGSVPDRTLEAVTLYRENYAPQIVLSRAPELPILEQLKNMGVRYPSASQLGRSIAEQLGVPSNKITEVGGRAPSTFTEAEDLLRFAAAQGYHTILLVSSKTHTRRAALIFRHLAGDQFKFIMRPSRYDSFQPEDWWHDRTSQRHVVFEYEKLLVFFLLDRWNQKQLQTTGGSAAPSQAPS